MPPLAVAIPVITRSEPSGDRATDKGKAARRLVQRPRTYDDGPLPVRPSDFAPKNAQIINRSLHANGATYMLKIGEVAINDVEVEEILEYVSPRELEAYENRQFHQETEVLNVLAIERQRQRIEKLERQKERAKRKGVVVFEDVDSTEEVTEGGEVEVGKHGRARPTYTHLFKKVKERIGRKMDSDTGELMSLSDDENGGISTENEPVPQTVVRPSTPLTELPKRRRRKRDKVTGELLPLSPVAQPPTGAERKLEMKRQRRKRHPLTGELMPVGWRYDPDNDREMYEMRRDGLGSHSFRKLSISQEHDAKRQRLDTESSGSRSPSPLPTKAQLAAQHSPVKSSVGPSPKGPLGGKTVLELLSSDDESDASPAAKTPSNLKPLLKPATATPGTHRKRAVESTETSSPPESSPEPERRTLTLQPSAAQARSPQQAQDARTSILNPSFTRTSSTDPLAHRSDNGGGSGDDLDDDEWFIEAILEHRQSDPKTHPPAFENEPVMLYLVKWEGFDEPTWEPIESFGDRSVVTDYRRRVALESESSDEDITMVPATSTDPLTQPTRIEQPPATDNEEDQEEEEEKDDDEDLEQDEFEVEAIMAHHFSDPRSHPPELGRTPVILYKVKWKGWEKPTWEPSSSFEDKSVLQKYHEHISRNTAGDGDDEMMSL